jgi:hypothetical protein
MNLLVPAPIGFSPGDRKLTLAFFAVFSRFEFALKDTGFVKAGRHGEATPAWTEYADELRGQFAAIQEPRFVNACAFLRDTPPRRQVVANGRLRWEDTRPSQGESDERYVLRLVRTVRNNLFHGGKFPFGIGPDPDAVRNRQLLKAGMAVLERCLVLSPKLQRSYEHAA